MLRHIEGPMNEDWARKLHLGERFLCQLVVLPLALAVPDITMADVKLHQATALQEVRFARSSSKNLPGTGWTEQCFWWGPFLPVRPRTRCKGFLSCLVQVQRHLQAICQAQYKVQTPHELGGGLYKFVHHAHGLVHLR